MEKKPTTGDNLQPPSFVGDTQQYVTAREGSDVTITIELAPTGGTPTAICWWVVYTNHQSWRQAGACLAKEGQPIWLVELLPRLHAWPGAVHRHVAHDSRVRCNTSDAFYQHLKGSKFRCHIWNSSNARTRNINVKGKWKEVNYTPKRTHKHISDLFHRNPSTWSVTLINFPW